MGLRLAALRAAGAPLSLPSTLYFYSKSVFFPDYVAEIYETLISTSREDLKAVEEDLDRQTPQALHSMLQNKENKEEAIGKYHSRKQKETVI